MLSGVLCSKMCTEFRSWVWRVSKTECVCLLDQSREIEFILSILCRRYLTKLTAQFLLGNSLQMRLASHPFCLRTSLIVALSSYVKWRYTVFPIAFPVELGCSHLFHPITKVLKIFARNLHMLLRIDYISTSVIYFKCTLLLEGIISWHVWGRFFGPPCTV